MCPKGTKRSDQERPLWKGDTVVEPWMKWRWGKLGKHSRTECSSRGRSPCKGQEAGTGIGAFKLLPSGSCGGTKGGRRGLEKQGQECEVPEAESGCCSECEGPIWIVWIEESWDPIFIKKISVALGRERVAGTWRGGVVVMQSGGLGTGTRVVQAAQGQHMLSQAGIRGRRNV